MTETAIHVLEDGYEEEIKIEDVTDAMAHDTYLCNGCGGTCRVEMYAVRNGKEPHFHTKRNQHHASGCDNDHSIAAQIVRSLDHTGSTTSMEELLDKFIRAHLEDEDEEHGKGDKGKKGKGDGKPKGAGMMARIKLFYVNLGILEIYENCVHCFQKNTLTIHMQAYALAISFLIIVISQVLERKVCLMINW